MLRRRENFAATPTQLRALKTALVGKRLRDFVTFLKMEKRLICHPGWHSESRCKEVQITTVQGFMSVEE